MKKLSLFLFFSLALTACDAGFDIEGADGTPTLALGKTLYSDNCARCHGANAEGGEEWSRPIAGMQNIADVVKNGRGEMPAFPRVTDNQLSALALFLASLSQPDLSTKTGKEYYAIECASCHGANGEGTTSGYGIQLPVAGYASWVIRNGRTGTGFPSAMPAYTTAQLSATQLSEIITWLKAMPRPTDGKGLYNTFCANCHGKDARGGVVGESIRTNLNEWTKVIRSGEGGSNYGSRTGYMPSWTSTELSDAEITLMKSYVQTL